MAAAETKKLLFAVLSFTAKEKSGTAHEQLSRDVDPLRKRRENLLTFYTVYKRFFSILL